MPRGRLRDSHRQDHKKRHHDDDDDDEGQVDDLAHAAMFAMMPTMTPNVVDSDVGEGTAVEHVTTEETAAPENDDIELEEESMGDESEGSDVGDDSSEIDKGDDNDDEESDVDLAEALAKMDAEEDEDEDEDEEDGNGNGKPKKEKLGRPPTTENEMDAYRTPIQELEQHLQFQLSVNNRSSASSGDQQNQRKLTAANLQLAGRVKHYMAFDRTVVVESCLASSSSMNKAHGNHHQSGFRNDNAPLDEGSLLVLRPPPSASSEQAKVNEQEQELLIPLGRVFEVFGPVSRPLYTIRLPTHAVKSKVETAVDKKESKEGDDGMKSSMSPSESATTTTDTDNEKNISLEHPTAATNIPPVKVLDPDGDDPWAPNGTYAKLLQLSLEVYYVRDEAKLIDTGLVMKASRKGCDASNVYDEEVINSSEMYYSDDEEERQAKNRRKGRESSHSRGGVLSTQSPQPSWQQNQNYQPPALPSGFHHVPNNSGRQNMGPPQNVAPLPQGFHSVPPPPSQRPHQYGTAPMAGSRPHPYSYSGPGRSGGGAPPPPPPHGSSEPPPAYQY